MRHMEVSNIGATIIQRQWCRRQSRRLAKVTAWIHEMSVCCVCHDECATLVRCRNGHGCCSGCDASNDDRRCPICRELRAPHPDAILPMVTKIVPVHFKCSLCETYVPSTQCEKHRAWCPSFKFTCPCGTCTETVTVATMKHHVLGHNVPFLLTSYDRESVFYMVITRYVSDTVLVVDDTTFVLSNVQRRTHVHLSDIMSGQVSLHMRAYYPHPASHAWTSCIQQVRVTDVSTDSWIEEYRMGIVPPVIASRESVITSSYLPVIVPRCMMYDSAPVLGERPALVLEDDGRVSHAIRNHNVRDIPMMTKPHDRIDTTNGVPVAVLRIHLRRTPTIISDVYDG